MALCEAVRHLFAAGPAAGNVRASGLCPLTGRACGSTVYAGFAVAQSEQRCPVRLLLALLFVAAALDARSTATGNAP